jgi:POT family proton-dependent oligopeptide transporter
MYRAVILGALGIAAGQMLMGSPALLPRLAAALTGTPVVQILAEAGVPLGHLRIDATTESALRDATALACNETASCTGGADQVFGLVRIVYRACAYAFPLGLALLALGTGLLKPNITAMLGSRYLPDDPRRDRGFTLFYVAINVGGVVAGILSGWFAERLGWSFGFILAAGAMMLGYAVLVGARSLRQAGVAAASTSPDAGAARVSGADDVRLPRGPLLYVGSLAAIATIFFGAYMQSGGVLNLYIYEHVDRKIGGFLVPAAWFFILTPAFVVALGPVFQSVVEGTARRWRPLGTIDRFHGGFALATVAFLLLAYGAASRNSGEMLHFVWPIAIYLVLALAELSISPAGNAMASRYVPARASGRMMAIWFLCYAGGSLLSGYLGSLADAIGIVAMLLLTAGLLISAAATLQIVRRKLDGLVDAQ